MPCAADEVEVALVIESGVEIGEGGSSLTPSILNRSVSKTR
jgi:hypothetical protein